jgi:hypothetical protein
LASFAYPFEQADKLLDSAAFARRSAVTDRRFGAAIAMTQDHRHSAFVEREIMELQSNLFKDDPKLQACLVRDSAHVTPGAVGNHVTRIQTALAQLDGFLIDPSELAAKRYGPSTAAAVLSFKKKRRIINFSYQTQEDNIVGKMTIAALDKEIHQKELAKPTIVVEGSRCGVVQNGRRESRI